MKPYDPRQPLFSLHVPKCAGQSFCRLLIAWFGAGFQTHYFQRRLAPPPRLDLGPGACLHGHFNKKKGIGADQYYPDAAQYITVLRDPLEIHLSNYFFWKRKSRRLQIDSGQLAEGSEHDYRSIDDFFTKRPRSHLMNFLPAALSQDNFREFFEEHFVWVGLVENLEETIPVLAERLGFAAIPLERLNASARDEEPSPGVIEAFRRDNPLEFEIVRHVREQWLEQGVGLPPGAGGSHG